MQALLNGVGNGALLYDLHKQLLLSNEHGRALLASCSGGKQDPWRLGDISLDALLHRVLLGTETQLSELCDAGPPYGMLAVRAARVESAERGRLALVTLAPLAYPGASPEQDGNLLREARAELISRLLPGIAHEVRGPLTTVSGVAQVLALASELPADLRDGLTLVQQQVERVDGLLRNVVAFSRGPRAARDLPLSINDAVRRALELLAHDLRTNRTTVETVLDPEIPLVAADPEEILQLLLELLSESLAGAPAAANGMRRLRLQTTRLPGLRAELRLETAGPGLDPAPPATEHNPSERLARRLGATLRRDALGATLELPSWSAPTSPRARQLKRVLIAEPDLDCALAALRELRPLGMPLSIACSVEVIRRQVARLDLGALLVAPCYARELSREDLPELTLLSLPPGGDPQAREAARALALALRIPASPRSRAAQRLVALLSPPLESDAALTSTPAERPKPHPTAAAKRSRGPRLPRRIG